MTYDKDYIFNEILGKVPFDMIGEDDFNDESGDGYIGAYLPDDCETACGASKYVILPPNADYVIKIPFKVSDDYQDCGHYTHNEETDEDEWVEDEGEGYYLEFEGAEYCLTGEVGWDYCRAEAEYYQAAEDEGLQIFFAKTVYIGSICGWPIYVQERCSTFYNSDGHPHSDEERHSTEKRLKELHIYTHFATDFVIDLINQYGEDETKHLFQFLEEYRIGDMHTSNYGYMGDYAILIDYSSFNE